jgi:CubicO group peptidase (beta-lactamase class C family)
MRSAVAELRAALDAATSGQRSGLKYDANVTSSSVGVVSIYDDVDASGAAKKKGGAPLFQHHHTAAVRNTTAGTRAPVDGDTVYRVGSVSKAVTTLALLRELARGGRVAWDDPVTKYLPELAAAAGNSTTSGDGDADTVERIRWNQVTLQALACQLGGVPRTYTLADLSVGPQAVETATALGLPPPSEIQPVECGANETQRACTKQGKSHYKTHPYLFL